LEIVKIIMKMAYRSEVHMDLEQLEPVHTAREHTNSVDALKIDPSGRKKFATGSHDRTIKIWDIAKVKVTLT
jgi:WD40 repeat protein